MRLFVTAIGTDSGKTVASAILCKALDADYWKPIQCGEPADSGQIAQLAPGTKQHPEAYYLKMPASPHAAAKAEGVEIDIASIKAPYTEKALIIEGAGGCMVPLNDQHFIIDLVPQLEASLVLVANLYLGSINHTLLSWQLIQARKLQVAGIIFNGPSNPESERIILQHTGYKKLMHIEQHTQITPELIDTYAKTLREQF